MTPPDGKSPLVQSGLGLLLVLAGVAGALAMWMSFRHAMETRSWKPAGCLVASSQLVSERPTPNSPVMHRADVRYRYTVDGTTYEGNAVRRGMSASSDLAKMKAVVDKYPPGTETTCFVNPADPSGAILEHSSKAALYTIWFPLLFVAGGAGIIAAAWRRQR
jgi:hypothetical protein